MLNTCVCCGEVIPEGTQVCKRCQQRVCTHLWDFDGFDPDGAKNIPGVGSIRNARWKCRLCGKRRTEDTVRRSFLWGSVQRAMREESRKEKKP